MSFNKENTKKILDACNDRLVDVIGDFIPLRKHNNEFSGECPLCHGETSFKLNEAKGIFKCFKCNNISGNNAVDFLYKAQNQSFPEALDYLNRRFSIVADIPFASSKKVVVKKETKKTASYCERMLTESGLSPKDVSSKIITITEAHTTTDKKIFRPGTVNKFFDPIDGDDVIIEYYDIEGNPVKYETKDSKGKYTGKFKEFFRVRFQFPDENKDSKGKPAKYKSPYGSGNFLYIPEKLRELYNSGQTIDRLFLQEGEKKAEKACKHGVWSVGIAGIQNIARDGKLPEDLIKIIQKMGVKEVCLLFDADWNELSNNIKINDSVDGRPRNFFYAAKNFKEYMRSLKNRELYIEIYVGHVKPNERHDKGIDDLLANTLKATPEVLAADIDFLINEKNLTGKYLQLFKITSWPDNKLEELWSLNNPSVFAKTHFEILKNLPEFKIGRHIWRLNEKEEIESAQPLESDEKYWEEVKGMDRNGNEKPVSYEFRYGRCFTFLQNRGYYRYMNMDGKTYQFIHINHPTVRTVEPFEIRDYVTDFTKVAANESILEMIYKGGVQYLGPDKLSNLNFNRPDFEESSREYQRLYFKDRCWEIKESEIKELDYSAVSYNIWSDQKHDFPATLLKRPMINVTKDEAGKLSYTLSPEGERCQFLQFLINASNFTWRKEKQLAEGETGVTVEPEELQENIVHLISKLAAMGYLSLSAKDRSVSRAVIAMDGKQSEVGQSNGRSGKSILGEAQKHIMPTVYIDGKKKEIESDPFLWDSLTEKSKCVFVDDVRVNFSLEFLFAPITGDWNVNYKGGRRATFPFNHSPKLYITSNHALNGSGSSFMDRQYIIAFSDFYNDEHKPKDDFGGLFFDDWDFDQWNLFWNLLANCLQIYLRYGVIQAPRERIETRQLRQQMGETFLSWADEYWSDPDKLNIRLKRQHLYEDFIKYSNLNPKLVSPTSFKNKIKSFCTWKGFAFNPHLYDQKSGKPTKYDHDGRPDLDDKSGGVEYFLIGILNSEMGTLQSDGTYKKEILVYPVVSPENEVRPANDDDKPF